MGDAFHINSAAMVWFTGAMVLIAIAIAALLAGGEYTRKARVVGFLAPNQGLVKVFTPQAGTVTHCKVKEGQQVQSGDELFVLSSDQASLENNDAQATAITTIIARRDSLLAELEQQDDLNRVQWQDMHSQVRKLEQEIRQIQSETRLQQQRVDVATRTLEKFHTLYQQHYVSEVQWQDKQEQVLALQGSVQNLVRDQIGLERERDSLQGRIAAARFEFARQRSELDRLISALEQQLTEYQAKRSIVITAPASGTVTGILLQQGQVAGPQSPLLSILPQGSQLQANLLVPSRAIGFIAPGQTVALRYQAFPYQRFGSHPGEVSEISRAIISPGEADFPIKLDEPAYRVIVTPSQQSLQAYTQTVPLQSGMLLDADIKLDRRSLIQWIFDPLYSLAGTL